MKADDPLFNEFLAALRTRVNDKAMEVAEDTEDVAASGFREQAFTEVMLDSLEDLGQLADIQACYFERKLGRGSGKVNAWGMDDDEGQLTLVTTIFRGAGEPGPVPPTELKQVVDRCLRVYAAAQRAWHSQMEPASEAYDMMRRLHAAQEVIRRIRLVVLVDGFLRDPKKSKVRWDGPHVKVDVWDLRRVFRAQASGLPYEPIEIDLVERLNAPLPCIASPGGEADFAVYLAVLPGELIHALYHQYGSRLLELNVRSFLQARGTVNRGIRDTIKNEPDAFIAYNNGISATAEEVEIRSGPDGLGLAKVKGLQVVNGGQTVASIHRAKDRDRLDISKVFVQAKLTVVRPERIESLVPLISRYSNTQNRVNEADFSANHPFHVKLQQLSETIWVPGEQSRWFYERARGQYQVLQVREGTTAARLTRFKQANPVSQRFDKVELAKYVNAWEQRPHVVSRGGQKNFVAFMQLADSAKGQKREPDSDYYRRVIAQAIIFKRAEAAARQHKFPGYRANAVAYTVALTSALAAGRVDLEKIWNEQAVPSALASAIHDWMPIVYEALVNSAGGRNVTEWCKRDECWEHMRALELVLPPALAEAPSGGGHPDGAV
ncbi:MAG: AIPR family protein [Deltaproteobacteria bacterium]|nr:AIPR family protein [Deltaproteobacteria bacterium]